MTKCRCGERVIWMKTKVGREIPVNYDKAISKETYFDFNNSKMVAHFNTCRFTEKFRKVD